MPARQRRVLFALLASLVLAATMSAPSPAFARSGEGPRIDLTVQDADLRHVATFLAREAKRNIVFAKGVQGSVTVHLERVPVLSALRVIVRSAGYRLTQDHGVLLVMPL